MPKQPTKTRISRPLQRLVGAIEREMNRCSKLSCAAAIDAPHTGARYRLNTAWVNLEQARDIILTEISANTKVSSGD